MTYFQNIDEEIKKLLQTAQQEIIVNVPWFTDASLFDCLLKKARENVAVFIAIEDDNINQRASFDHEDIILHKGFLYRNVPGGSHALNHEKYCIIDRQTVIFGSYNWTYRAANANRESIMVFQDPVLANQFYHRFQEAIRMPSMHVVVNAQAAEVGTDMPVAETTLLDVNFLLRCEIALLEETVAFLQQEKLELENRIEYFSNHVRIALQDLILEKSALELQLAQTRAAFTRKAADQANVKEQEEIYKQTYQTFEQAQVRQSILNQEVDTDLLRKLYREATVMAHPDKFYNEPDKQQKANELMSQLSEAYRNKNLSAIQAIWQALKDGVAFGIDWTKDISSEALARVLDSLKDKKSRLEKEILDIKSSLTYQHMEQFPDVSVFIEETRMKLKADIHLLNQELSNYP